MKVIISHDVDHLYTSDHYFKDLIVEKLLIRSFFHMLQKKVTAKNFFSRVGFVFTNKMNNIRELVEFDKKHSIPSTFFFGMKNGLGMSYSRKKTKDFVTYVEENGFDVGVHGIAFDNERDICEEHTLFSQLFGHDIFGVRNHYVRFNNRTFTLMAKAGYCFDSTYFNKKEIELIAPFKVDSMWEFPLHIMDVYVCEPGKEEEGIQKTINIMASVKNMGIGYCTILFHDAMYNENAYPKMKLWYETIVDYCEKQGYEFISFKQAIRELENV